MSVISVKKINTFTYVIIFSSLVLFLWIAVLLRGIAGAISESQRIDEGIISADSHLNIIKLDEAYDAVEEKRVPVLDLSM